MSNGMFFILLLIIACGPLVVFLTINANNTIYYNNLGIMDLGYFRRGYMKKLEPGCKAVTVNCIVPENNGKIVTVLAIGEKVPWMLPDGTLEEDCVVYTDTDIVDFQGGISSEMRAKKLRRIDDREETTTWEAMRDLWVPEQVKTVHKVTE